MTTIRDLIPTTEIDTDLIDQLIEKYKDHHFTEFIKDKSVVIVGPNTNLKGKNLGEYIDSFDIVVRSNTVFDFLPLNEELAKDYGSRTDIIYWSPTLIKRYANRKSTIKKLKECNVKYICYQNGNKGYQYFELPYCFPQPLNWFKEKCKTIGTKMHFCHHETKLIVTLMNNNNSINDNPVLPRTGYLPIFDCLIHQAGKIETIGLTFEDGGSNAFRPDALKTLVPNLNHDGTPSPHDSRIEEALAFKLDEIYSQFKFG